MKLYRFTAADSQKAMAAVTKQLGTDALIYSTRTTQEGVEVIAGYESVRAVHIPLEIEVQNHLPAETYTDRLNIQLQEMETNISKLSAHIELLQKTLVQQNHNKFYKLMTYKIQPMIFLQKLRRAMQPKSEADYGQ